MRDDREKLHDILEAMERVERYVIQGRQAFEENELIQTWFTQNLQIIGEASRSLSTSMRDPTSGGSATVALARPLVLFPHRCESNTLKSPGQR